MLLLRTLAYDRLSMRVSRHGDDIRISIRGQRRNGVVIVRVGTIPWDASDLEARLALSRLIATVTKKKDE